MRAIRIAAVLRPFCDIFERFALLFCVVLRHNFTFAVFLRCFVVFCRCFVKGVLCNAVDFFAL